MAGKRKIFTDKETLISMYNKYNSTYIIADKFKYFYNNYNMSPSGVIY